MARLVAARLVAAAFCPANVCFLREFSNERNISESPATFVQQRMTPVKRKDGFIRADGIVLRQIGELG